MHIDNQNGPKTRNALLSALPVADLEALWPDLQPTSLDKNKRMFEPDDQVDCVMFVETGVISMIAALHDGSRIEVGMVGSEGMAGLSLLFGTETASLEGLVQIPGSALRMGASAFRRALTQVPSLMPTLLRYVDYFNFQISVSAACNGRHSIEQRLARWLLMTWERAGEDNFPITQEFLSIMLGVRRPGVTLAVGTLQRAGIVKHFRGNLHVKDAEALERAACECYRTANMRLAKVMATPLSVPRAA